MLGLGIGLGIPVEAGNVDAVWTSGGFTGLGTTSATGFGAAANRDGAWVATLRSSRGTTGFKGIRTLTSIVGYSGFGSP